MQFNTNLATRSYVNFRQVNLFIAAVGFFLVLWLVWDVKDVAFNLGEINRLETQLASVEKKLAVESKGIPPKEYDRVLNKIQFANSVIYRKNFDWLNLLDQLESVVPEGVALSSVEPDVKKNNLKLTGHARTFDNLRRLFETLESSTYFRNVFLENQTAIKVGQNQKGVSFTITCTVSYK